MQMDFPYLFLVFMLYSFAGYICEIVCSSIKQKKLVNRGFLCGPYCPIYGVGSLFILFLLLRFKEDPVIVFVLGAILTSAIEYITSFVLEKIFHNKWWDYSDEKFNIHGRIFLFNSLLFGFGSLVIIYTGNEIVTKVLNCFSPLGIKIIAYGLLFIFIADFIYSFMIAYNLRNRLIICEELKNEKLAKLPGMLEKIIREKVEKFRRYPKRLLEAFPDLKNANSKEFDIMKTIRDYKKEKNKGKGKKSNSKKRHP